MKITIVYTDIKLALKITLIYTLDSTVIHCKSNWGATLSDLITPINDGDIIHSINVEFNL